MKLQKKVALVTGASTGIGKAIALEFASHRTHVIITARRENKLQQLSKQIINLGGESTVLCADLNNKSSIDLLIKSINNRFKKIDIITNVAGVWHGKNKAYVDINFESFPSSIVGKTINVGVLAPMLIVNGLLPKMREYSKC